MADCIADLIAPGLYLGNIKALVILGMCEPEEQSSWCVVSVLGDDDRHGLSMPRHVHEHHNITIDDAPDADLAQHFVRAHGFIQRALEQDKTVLVHCMAGISRSATIVAAHLMLERKIGRDEALAIVRKARSIVGPNHGFREQLKELEDAINT